MILGETKILQIKNCNQILGCAVLVCTFFVLPTSSQRKTLAPANPAIQKVKQLLQNGKLGDAEILLQAYLAKTPEDLAAKVLMGVVFDQRNRVVEAESIYREVLKQNPHETSALANLGVLLVRTNRLDEAQKVLERVLKLQPGHQQAAYNLAALYSGKNEQNKALPLLEGLAGISLRNKTPRTTDFAILFALTKAYAATGKTKEAVTIADILEMQRPDDERLLFTVGLVLAEAHEYRKATLLFEKVKTN